MSNNRFNVVYVFTSCRNCGPIQIMLNFLSNIDFEMFNPTLITIYEENEDSELQKFIDLGIPHQKITLQKKDILLGKTDTLKKAIEKLNPDIIHSMGVFPEYAISHMGFDCQVITLHNFMHEDYLAKYGKLRGIFLEKMQMYAVRHSKKVWTCSSSLADIYQNHYNMKFDYVRNGVNLSKFFPALKEDKSKLREKLSLPQEKRIYVYTGQFIDRKDQVFLIDVFQQLPKGYVLILLGDGPLLNQAKERANNRTNIIFTGNVNNVDEYLKASDVYISCSHSEGLPTSVLEAMATGLPVILSDILQHKEIFEANSNIGKLYALGNSSDCLNAINAVDEANQDLYSAEALKTAQEYFSATIMAGNYQREYLKIIEGNRI